MNSRQLLVQSAVLLVLVFIVSDADAQCAMCKAIVESDESGNSITAGLNSGILYLMSLPYILLIGLGIMLFRKAAKNNQS